MKKLNFNVKVDLSQCKFDESTLRSKISEALEYGAENVCRTAKELAPEDTGALRDSIHVTGNNWTFHVQPGTPMYDLYMEEALNSNIGRIIEFIEEAIGDVF